VLLPPERSTVPGKQFRLLVDGALQCLHAAASVPVLNDIGQALEGGCSAACVKRCGWQKTEAISGGGPGESECFGALMLRLRPAVRDQPFGC